MVRQVMIQKRKTITFPIFRGLVLVFPEATLESKMRECHRKNANSLQKRSLHSSQFAGIFNDNGFDRNIQWVDAHRITTEFQSTKRSVINHRKFVNVLWETESNFTRDDKWRTAICPIAKWMTEHGLRSLNTAARLFARSSVYEDEARGYVTIFHVFYSAESSVNCFFAISPENDAFLFPATSSLFLCFSVGAMLKRDSLNRS